MVDAENRIAEYGVGGGITWDSLMAGEYDETVAKARVLTARRHTFELLESMRRDPGEPIRRLEQHVERLRGSAAYFGYAFDEAAVRTATDEAGAGSDRPIKIRLRLSRVGAIEVSWAALDRVRPGTPPPGARRRAGRSGPTCSCSTRRRSRRRYEDARARHPEADDVILVNARGAGHRDVGGEHRREARWPPVDPSAGCGAAARDRRASLLADGAFQERVDLHRRGAHRGRSGRVQLGARMAARRAGGLEVGRRILDGERERVHPILVHRAGAERATRGSS